MLKQAKPEVLALNPYQTGRPIEEVKRLYQLESVVKLASNENAFGASPNVLKVIQNSDKEALLRYPDGNGYALKQSLSAFHQIAAECITLGNGSNDVLEMIARVFLGQGRAALFSQHAFAVYPLASLALGAPLQVVPAHRWGCDLDGFLQRIDECTQVIFIANPNNPTGTFLTTDKLLNFLSKVPNHVVVVLDEAYNEYIEPQLRYDSVPWLQNFPNLIITRTFSKAYGLAGLRVGYALASAKLTDLLNRVRQPFNVNQLALMAAEVALEDQTWLLETVEQHHICKQRLFEQLQELGLSWIDSQANFVSVCFGDKALKINQLLLENGVIVRDLEAYQMPEYLRISVGKQTENDCLIRVLTTLM